MGLGVAIALFGSISYSLMVIALLMLPETLGRGLDTVQDGQKARTAKA
jgi:hypothetical protein